VNEKKYNFRLSDALKKARDAKSKSLEGQTFYSTSRVQSLDILKRVVMSSGGKVNETSTQYFLHTANSFA
jgi:hypothetical protein